MLVLLEPAHGGKIIWRSLARPHLASDGSPMTADVVFELGVFAQGFVPTKYNRSQWETHWRVAAETPYNESEGRFSDTYVVTSNALPFHASAQGYIWGKQGQEWVLMTGDLWKWPSTDPLAFAVTWSTLSADTVLAGTLSADETETHLRTDRIEPGITPSVWAVQRFGTAGEIDWLADDDEDGLSNQLEYAFDLDPQRFDADLPIEIAADGKVTVAYDPARAVTVRAEFSRDLVTWSTVPPSSWALVSEDEGGQTFAPGQEHAQIFLRVRADW